MKQICTIFLLSAMLCSGGCIDETGDDIVNRVTVGDEVPEFRVKKADGATDVGFEQSDFMGIRSVILFFQTTCGDCRREMPKIHEAWQYFSKNRDITDVQFILISRGENAATVSEYWTSTTESKPSFSPMPYYLDPERAAYNKFANSYVPRIYLIGTDGLVKYLAIETFDFDGTELIKKIYDLQ
jgi:thiol-disulfide isomerase/thioredoxin